MGLFDFLLPRSLLDDIRLIKQQTYNIQMDQKQATEKLNTISAQLTKVGGETATLVTNVADLKKSLEDAQNNGGTITPELEAAINTVATQAQTVDDLVPDAP